MLYKILVIVDQQLNHNEKKIYPIYIPFVSLEYVTEYLINI